MVPDRRENDNPLVKTLSGRIGVRFTPSEKNRGSEDESVSVNDGVDTEGKGKAASNSDNAQGVPGKSSSAEENQEAEEDDENEPEFEKVLVIYVGNTRVEIVSQGFRGLEDLSGQAVLRIPSSYLKQYREEEDAKRKDHNTLVRLNDAWLLRYTMGRGAITVFSDISFLTNWQIEKRDHAYYFAQMVADAEKVWLVYSSNIESLTTLLWLKAPLFLVSFALFVLSYLWMRQMRGGPREMLCHDFPQNILTHIQATGNYFWRIDKCRKIIENNRLFLRKRLRGRTDGRSSEKDFSDRELVRLGEKTGMPEDELKAVFQRNCESEQDLIRLSRVLQKISISILRGEKE